MVRLFEIGSKRTIKYQNIWRTHWTTSV